MSTNYYWSDGEMTTETERFNKNFYTKKMEETKATIVAKTVTKTIDEKKHQFHYVLCDAGELFNPNEISVRYKKKPWKFVLVKNVTLMKFYLSFLGFKTSEEVSKEEFVLDKDKIRAVSAAKGSLSLLRKAERYL